MSKMKVIAIKGNKKEVFESVGLAAEIKELEKNRIASAARKELEYAGFKWKYSDDNVIYKSSKSKDFNNPFLRNEFIYDCF